MGTILHKNLTQPNQHEPLAVGTYSQQTSGSLSGGSVNGTTMVTPELTATNIYSSSIEMTDIRITGSIYATFNAFAITGDLYATNATFYGNVSSSSYLVTSFCGLQQEALATWMPFKFNDGVGVDVTGMEFNVATAYASLVLNGAWFWRSNFSSGDMEVTGSLKATSCVIGAATLTNTEGSTTTQLSSNLQLTGNNAGLYFNDGVQNIFGDGTSLFFVNPDNDNRIIFGNGFSVINKGMQFTIEGTNPGVRLYGEAGLYTQFGDTTGTAPHSLATNEDLWVQGNHVIGGTLFQDSVAEFKTDISVGGTVTATAITLTQGLGGIRSACIIAEEASNLSTATSGGLQFSYGNGDIAGQGTRQPVAGKVIAMSMQVNTAGVGSDDGTVEIALNGAAQGANYRLECPVAGAGGSYEVFATPLAFSADDRITFITTTTPTTTVNGVVMTCWVLYD